MQCCRWLFPNNACQQNSCTAETSGKLAFFAGKRSLLVHEPDAHDSRLILASVSHSPEASNVQEPFWQVRWSPEQPIFLRSNPANWMFSAHQGTDPMPEQELPPGLVSIQIEAGSGAGAAAANQRTLRGVSAAPCLELSAAAAHS